MIDQREGNPERSEADDTRFADRSLLHTLKTQLDAWSEAHKEDDREAASVKLPRETVTLLSRAVRRGLNADVALEELAARVARTELFAKASPGCEKTRLRRALRYLRTGDDDEEERRGKRRPIVDQSRLAWDYFRMAEAPPGHRDFEFKNPTHRAARRPPLLLTCPVHPVTAVRHLVTLYGLPSEAACIRHLERARDKLRRMARSSEDPIVREGAERILSTLPSSEWGDPPVEPG
jgi:hypothetical protein